MRQNRACKFLVSHFLSSVYSYTCKIVFCSCNIKYPNEMMQKIDFCIISFLNCIIIFRNYSLKSFLKVIFKSYNNQRNLLTTKYKYYKHFIKAFFNINNAR